MTIELLPEVEVPVYFHRVVYFIQATNGLVKIGRSLDPATRLIRLQAMSPLPLRLVGWVPERGRYEGYLHFVFTAERLHGEWFQPSDRLLSLASQLRDLSTGPERLRILKAFIENHGSIHQVATRSVHGGFLL